MQLQNQRQLRGCWLYGPHEPRCYRSLRHCVNGAPGEQVLRLATLAQTAGLDGVVCSAQEISKLRAECGPDFKLVVPGIRPQGSVRPVTRRER